MQGLLEIQDLSKSYQHTPVLHDLSFAIHPGEILCLLGVSVGFSLPQYALLFGVVALLATAAALCINAFFKVADTANMAGTCILILTSILAGSFYKWTIHNAFFKGLSSSVPAICRNIISPI